MLSVQRIPTASLALLLLFLLPASALAGTTGKVAGQVTDRETREPLVGANVSIEGTTLGGVTDIEGAFTILNVPPGTYRVRASMVGYSTLVMNDVRVFIDQTTRVTFTLTSQTVEVGEVTVMAERRPVKEDVSTSVTSVNSQEVKSLPIASVTQVADLQAGVEQGLVIRGGGADQSLFLLDGATLRDPRNNQPITGVALSAVQEVSIERGGFLAEYGQLRSGIVNVVTKEGGQAKYSISVTARVSPPQKKYFGISPYDPNSMWLRPYLDPAVCWTGTNNGAWDYYTQRQYPSFEGWEEISRQLMTDDDPANDLTPAGAQRLFTWQHRKTEKTDVPDYNIDAGFGGPMPFIGEDLGNLRFFVAYRNEANMLLIPLSRYDYYTDNWSLRLTSDIAPSMKLDITGTLGRSFYDAVNGGEQLSSTDYLVSPEQITGNISLLNFNESRVFIDSYYSLARVNNWSVSGLFTHMLSSTGFYEVRLEHLARKYETGPIALRNPTKQYELYPGYYVDETPFGWSPFATTGIGASNMILGGHTGTARDSTRISMTTLKGNFTMQLDQHNQIKAGVEFVYNELNLDYGIVNLAFPESNNYVRESRFPLRGAVYLQDKLEFQGFIANVGVRLDYSNANVLWPDVATFDKSYYTSSYDPNKAYPTKKAEPELIVSPRLGISHPITEDAKLFFNFGHFRQLPTYEQLLRYSRNVTGALRNIGDPNLLMASTVAYELGFDYSFLEDYLIQIAGFYRDIKDQQDFTTYISNATSGNFQYVKANNNSYQDIRGFELTLKKTRGMWVNGFINFTYQSTKSGRFNRDRIYQDPTDQRQYDLDTRVLYQYRPIPRPFARMAITFFTPPDLGPGEAGLSILGDWTLTVLGDWRSGGYVTWNPNSDPSVADNVQAVDYMNFNLRLSKAFSLGPTQVTLFADLQNVLNTKRLNLNSFYDVNDQQDYFNSLHLPTGPGYSNIPGDDKVGDYRPDDVLFQPIEQVGQVNLQTVPNPNPAVIYYERTSGRYLNYVNSEFAVVDPGRMEQVLDDKAYINMPNMTSFHFLNPRNIFFGITVGLEL